MELGWGLIPRLTTSWFSQQDPRGFSKMKVRSYFPGMGQAVADRTVNRPGENWGDVAQRVALGSHLLHPESGDQDALQRHISQASILLSGRHLQHGDESQPSRPGEVFTNCSTAI